MTYKKINLQQELRRVAQRKPTTMPVDILAALLLQQGLAARTAEATPRDRRRGGWLPFITGLHALEDPRPNV